MWHFTAGTLSLLQHCSETTVKPSSNLPLSTIPRYYIIIVFKRVVCVCVLAGISGVSWLALHEVALVDYIVQSACWRFRSADVVPPV